MASATVSQSGAGSAPVPVAVPVGAPSEDLHRGRYARAYELRGEPGQCLIQRVDVRIRYRRGSESRVDYRGRYHEFFRFTAPGARVTDLHDFDLKRDRWNQAAILRLLRSRGSDPSRDPGGEPALEVTKTFLLGRGIVESERPIPGLTDGVDFGFLAEGPGGSTRAALTLSAWGADRKEEVEGAPSCPGHHVAAGTGKFTSADGWRTVECFTYRFSTTSGTLRSDDGYLAVPMESHADSPVEEIG